MLPAPRGFFNLTGLFKGEKHFYPPPPPTDLFNYFSPLGEDNVTKSSYLPALFDTYTCPPRSDPLGAPQRHLQRQRDLAVPGVGGARGQRRAERPGLQRGVQEVPAGPEPVHALRRQRGHRPPQAGAEAEEGGGEEPAGSHPLQLRGAGRQRRLREEVGLAQLLHRQHHHQPGR